MTSGNATPEDLMKATAVSLLVLFLALTVGPVTAAPDTPAQIGEELRALTDAIDAQLKLLSIYEGMGKVYDAAETKKTLLGLVERQEKLLAKLARSLGRKDTAPIRIRVKQDAKVTGRIVDKPVTAHPPKSVKDVIARGLAWLSQVQDKDGYWDCDGFMENPVDGAGGATFDTGVTGLAVLAFLGDGHTHKSGEYRNTLLKGLRHLKQVQDPEGCFGPRTEAHFTYNHAIATLAMVEAYRRTASPLFKQSAQLGIDFIHKAQNPYLAWRYGVRPTDNDTSVTGWMVAALAAGKRAGFRTSDAAFTGAMAWMEKATEPEYGRVGYTARGTGPARPENLMDVFPADKSESLTAEGLAIRLDCGVDPKKDEAFQKGVTLLGKVPPEWNTKSGTIDMYYWFWGTRALRQMGGPAWKAWRKPLVTIAMTAQRREGRLAGSFDPVDPWGAFGGRVYSTAVMTLVAEGIEVTGWVDELEDVEVK
jgi:hypothetical protein